MNESVEVRVAVESTHTQEGTFEARLFVDGTVVDTQSVRVPDGGTETVVFEHRFLTPGVYEIAVDDWALGTLTVTLPTETATATPTVDTASGLHPIQLTDASLSADWVEAGYGTTVRATVVNIGDQNATRTLTVTVDDRPVANETVSLGPSERSVVPIEFDAANGMVAVEGVEAGELRVGQRTAARTPTETDTAGTGVVERGGVTLVGTILLATGVIVLLAAVVVRATQRPR